MNQVYILTKEGRTFTTTGIEFIVKNCLKDPQYKINLNDKTLYHQGTMFNDPNYFVRSIINDHNHKDRCFIVCSLPEKDHMFFMELDDYNLEIFKKQLSDYANRNLKLTTWQIFKIIDETLNHQ